MRKLFWIWCVAALLLSQARAAAVIAGGEFSGAEPVTAPAGSGSFEGALPGGWQENFVSWTKSRVNTVLNREGDSAFLTFRVLEIGGAAPQFLCKLPALEQGAVYRLNVIARNRSAKDAAVSLRMIPAPYKTYGTIHIQPGKGWKSFSRIVKWQESAPAETGIFLTLNAVGEFDVRRIVLEKLDQAEAKAEAEAGRFILQTVFFLDGKESAESKTGSFRGVLPAPWRQDYTHWNPARATSEIINRGPEHFLRIQVAQGSPQFLARLSGIKAKRTYRLTAYLRNRTGGPVKMSLRLLPAPYTTLSAGSWKQTESWSTQVIYFRTPAFQESLPVGLIMNIDGPGELDLVTLKLEEFNGATAALRRPPRSQKNFLRATRFPLGLPAGWNLLRGCADGTVSADAALRGPSGSPALRLASRDGGRIGICSEPFQVADPAGKQSLSFFFRGEGNFQLELWSEGKKLGALTLQPGGEWQRARLDFHPSPDALAQTFRIHGTGTLALDGFRVAPAGESEFLPGAPCEIALALPESELRQSGIQFDDEPGLIRYSVIGEYAGGTLRGRIVNLYGDVFELPPIPLTEKTASGTISCLRFPGRELGQFRVELNVEKENRPISLPAELVVTRIARPKYWGKDAPDSPFGIHVLPDEHVLKAVKAAGVNWVRFHDAGTEFTGWFYLEPEPGKWKFRDAEIDRYRDCRLKIFGQLGTAPRWASYLSRITPASAGVSYHDRYYQPLRLEEFAHYVSTVVDRYKGKIDDWFVWNEPWVPAWWGVARENGEYVTSKTPQADFAALTRAAYRAAREKNPAVRISGFNTTAGREGMEWTRGVLAAGGLADCDTIDFHFYTDRKTGFPGDACSGAWQQAIGPLAAAPEWKKKPVILSEGQGASLGSAAGDTSMRYAGFYNLTLPWKNEEDFNSVAERNVRYILSFLSLGVKRVFLYSAHCYLDFSQAPSFLVFFNADGTPHPMLAAHSAMARRLEDKKFLGMAQLGEGVWGYFFSDDRECTAVLTGRLSDVAEKLRIPAATVKWSDLYGNPVAWPSAGQELLYAEFPKENTAFSALFQNRQE